MAKTRSLPDKYYDKDYEHNGIHRVPLWRIACFALNNTATNLYMMMMGYATYYLMGWVGVGMMLASSLSMIMRIWDGVTDPFVGFMVDKTNGKFGKNRPFIVIGNIILAVTSFILFHVTHQLPQAVRFPFYVVVLMVYYLGYTCQCVVTKSAQSCMTNDPKQRPMFASFDGVFNTVLFAGLAVVFANMANSYKDVGGYASTQFFHSLWVMTAIVSGIFTATEGAGIAVLYCLILSIVYKSITFKSFLKILLDSAKTSGIILFLISASSAMSFVMAYSGIPAAISNGLMSLTSNKYIIFLLMNIILLVIGMFMDITPAILIFTPIFLPIATSFGMTEIQFGVMLIFNMCLGNITPPVGSVLFVGCGIGHVSIEQVTSKLIPYFVALVLALLAVTYIPALSLGLPSLMGLI